jgi:hypothetical protein
MSDGGLELISAIRSVLSADADLDEVPMALGSAPQGLPLPHITLGIQSNVPTLKLSRGAAYRTVTVSMKVSAVESGGYEALEIAKPLRDRADDLLSKIVDDTKPEARINAELAVDGWRIMIPLETGSIPPYKDYVGPDKDVERWHIGHLYTYRIQEV